MSSPNIADVLAGALTAIVSAVAGIIQGAANAIAANAQTIGTVLVIGGLVGLAVTTLTRAVPFVGGLFRRFLAG